MVRKYARIFVRVQYLSREANSFPRAQLEENYELRGTENVQGQISQQMKAIVFIILQIFFAMLFSDIPQFWLGDIRSRDVFRPIAREQKDLMDYN